MDTNTIYVRLNKVFRDVFDDDDITVNANTTANDIEDWDSLASMKNVGEMVQIIEKRAK